jgi:predicted O-methyltransferase YrrM
MHDILKEILETGQVIDENNNVFKLHSHTEAKQGKELQRILTEIKPKVSLEIGLAYGISSLFILEVISKLENSRHIIIDPFPDVYWNNIGLVNIKRAGYSRFITFYKDFSYNILPKLYQENLKIDFAYIDSTKVFDFILTDFFFIDKLLNVGGIVIFDDVSFPGIRKIARFISTNPNYIIILQHAKDKRSIKIKTLHLLQKFILNLVPFKSKFSSHSSFKSDQELGVDYHCIGFKKLSDDGRKWDWFKRF